MYKPLPINLNIFGLTLYICNSLQYYEQIKTNIFNDIIFGIASESVQAMSFNFLL